VELVRGVAGDVNGVAGEDGGLLPADGGVHLAGEEDEGLFEAVAVRGWAAVWRDVHVDKGEAAGGVGAGEKDGVGVADDAEVRQVLIAVGLGEDEGAGEVVGWKCGGVGHG